MRSTEQAVLQNAAAAYMNTLRDTAILALRKNNLAVLETQLSHTRERNRGGDVTSTDVAQVEAPMSMVYRCPIGSHEGFDTLTVIACQ